MANQSPKRPAKPISRPAAPSIKDKESQQKDRRPDVKVPAMQRDQSFKSR